MGRGIDSLIDTLSVFKRAVISDEYKDTLSADEKQMILYIFDHVMDQAYDDAGQQVFKDSGQAMTDVVCFFYVPAHHYCTLTGVKYSTYVKTINSLVDKGIIWKTGKLKKVGRHYTHLYNWNGDMLGLMERLSDWQRFGREESTVSPAEFIIHYLQDGAKTIQQMVDESGMTRARIGYALSQLESDNKVTIEKDGKFKTVSLKVVVNA